MLSFFRSIRQSLISEGKTVKYMKYAVGEFLLIVAGILVALQIQTWNENRKLEQDRRELVENLKSEFHINLNRLIVVIGEVEEIRDELEEFLKNTNEGTSNLTVQEIKTLAISVRPNNPFEPSLGYYRSAVSTGAIALLKDSPLNSLILEFELNNNRLQDMDAVGFALGFSDSGSLMDIRKQLGSLSLLGAFGQAVEYVPESWALKDDEYRLLISQREVFAHYELKWELKKRQLFRLNLLKEKTEQILAALEALD